jgi:hypothetical protein
VAASELEPSKLVVTKPFQVAKIDGLATPVGSPSLIPSIYPPFKLNIFTC